MFEELQVLSVERQFYSVLYSCEKISQVLHNLERSIEQLIPFEGLYILYENPREDMEKISGPKGDMAKELYARAKEYPETGVAFYRFIFGDERGGRGALVFIPKSAPSSSKICGVERMVSFCSRSLYHLEMLEKMETYAREQELLLRELRHRTKNNLQFMLASLPYLVPESEEISLSLREKLEQRLHGLIVLSSIWDSQSIKETVSALSYFQSVGKKLRDIWLDGRGSFELTLELDKSLIISKETATSIGLIENELITNTLKHSTESFPTIRIELRQKQDRLLFFYSESKEHSWQDFSEAEGLALNEEAVDYKRPGISSGQGQGIIQGLLQRTGGHLITEEFPGYQFKAWFPLKSGE